MKINKFAHHHSATSFLNSFFLEWSEGVEKKDNNFIVELMNNEKLIIPIKRYSKLGRHHYEGYFFLDSASEGFTKINFIKLVEKLTNFLAEQFSTTEEAKNQFINRVQSSASNVEMILRNHHNEETLKQNFIDYEQQLFIGHTFHPTPKSRDEFSALDFEKYSPETKASFPLMWILISKELYYEKSSAFFKDANWLSDIFSHEFRNYEIKKGFLPYPLHPWQAKFILNHSSVLNYIRSNQVIVVGHSEKEWKPTSSLRTLYQSQSDYMLKFSMNVKLTNSVRHLLVHELDRGLQVHEVFNHKEGKKFQKENPQFKVIHEPVYAGIKDEDGNPIQETLILGRDNPFKGHEEAIVVATLTQDQSEFQGNILHRSILTYANQAQTDFKTAGLIWFQKFLEVAIRPLILAQANYGILLGAHQQNMVLELDNSLPYKSYFRDCNGTGYSRLGKDLYENEINLIQESNGNILDSDVASFLFGYYVIINTSFNVISSISHSGWLTEERLIEEFQAFLLRIRNESLKDKSFLNYLLEKDYLMHKGNFLCSFKNINENTEKNPLSIYTNIPNPLFIKGSNL